MHKNLQLYKIIVSKAGEKLSHWTSCMFHDIFFESTRNSMRTLEEFFILHDFIASLSQSSALDNFFFASSHDYAFEYQAAKSYKQHSTSSLFPTFSFLLFHFLRSLSRVSIYTRVSEREAKNGERKLC